MNIKATVLILLTLATTQAIANGSERGHSTGNGHREYEHPPAHDGEGIAVGQSVVVDNANIIENSSSASASSRVDLAVGNNASAGATGGDGGAGGTGNASVEAISFSEDNDYSASSAASIYASKCSSGFSGQIREGGIGSSNTDQFCYLLDMALVNWQAYQRELKSVRAENCEAVTAEITCPAPGYVDCQVKACPSPLADKYLARYHQNLDDAQQIIDAGQEVSIADRVAGLLIKPLSILAGLILL